MTDRIESPTSAVRAKEDAASLVLRGRPRPVVRFRKSVVLALTGAFSVAVVALAWLALVPHPLRLTTNDNDSLRPARPQADAFAGAPRSYSDVPRLGPPLPGDLGRPILERQRELAENGEAPSHLSSDVGPATEQAEAARERRSQEEIAARTAAVIVQLADRKSPDLPASFQSVSPSEQSPAAGMSQPNQGESKLAKPGDGDTSPNGRATSAPPWTLAAGSVIPASLMTGLNSDLPGVVIAQVSENVRDSRTGRTVLIPQGARLIGKYDNAVRFGQDRAFVVWERILFPDGRSESLDNMPAADAAGHSGLSDHVDAHTWQLIKGAALSTLLGVGSELSIVGEGQLVRAVREATQQNASQAGEHIVARSSETQPTLVVRPGWPVRALVNKDLALQPWGG